MLVGQFMTGLTASVMFTVKVHELERPALLSAVHVTVVAPRPNVAGLSVDAAGEQPTLVIPLPAVAVAVGVYPVNETVADKPLRGVPI